MELSQKEKEKLVEQMASSDRELLSILISSELNLLPTISTISVAALALVSMNEKLIGNLFLFKISVIIFSSLIPISLWFSFKKIRHEFKGVSEGYNIPKSLENVREILSKIKIEGSFLYVLRNLFESLLKGQFKSAYLAFQRLFYEYFSFVLVSIFTVAIIIFIFSLSI
jgi:hypothetical protein